MVGHTFLRFARPEAFGDVRPEERRYGNVMDAYAAFLSQAVGDLARSCARTNPPRGLRVWHGAAAALAARLKTLMGDRWASGTHADAPTE